MPMAVRAIPMAVHMETGRDSRATAAVMEIMAMAATAMETGAMAVTGLLISTIFSAASAVPLTGRPVRRYSRETAM